MRAPLRACDDDGFTLVEVVVSLVLIAIVMTSALSLFLRAMSNTDIQAQRQQAITVANDQLEDTRAIKAADLVDGRTQAAVSALWTWDAALTSQSTAFYDTTATAASVPTIPTVRAATVDGVQYTVRTYVDRCYLQSSGSCTQTVVGTKPMLRVVVSVAWSPKRTRTCTTTKVLTGVAERCQEYVVTSLRDPSGEPTFNSN